MGRSTPDLTECLLHILSGAGKVFGAALAVRYECIQTVLALNGDSNLTERALEALGVSFLRACDDSNSNNSSNNNGRYVALNLLLKSFSMNKIPKSSLNAILSSIQACLTDSDFGIVAKAIDVIFGIFLDPHEYPENIPKLLEVLLDVLSNNNYFFTGSGSLNVHVQNGHLLLPSSFLTLPERLIMAIEKYSLEIGSKLFVDMLLKILESIPLREECYDDAPQKAISILSRHLAADASIQRYAVHRAAASLSKVNDGASVGKAFC